MLLALDPVDLLEAEEPPVHLQAPPLGDLAHPEGGLVRPRTDHVEVEVDPGGRLEW
jgi:hypothetical protein